MSLSPDKREQLRQRYLQVDTSNAADALDEFGRYDQALSGAFVALTSSVVKLAGWAFTLRGQMTPYPVSGGDTEKMRACDAITPGSVTVWGGSGAGVCFFGELIALRMQERGSVGAIVDGGVRDLAWINRHEFPVHARYRTPVQSIGRWKVNAFDVPVVLPGATSAFVPVNSGDFILADDDGALVIPADLTEPVLERAEQLTATERRIREELRSGLSLDDALDRFGHV